MTTGTHAVVWIDNSEARVIMVDRRATGEVVEHSQNAGRHLRSKAGSREGYRATADHVFFQRVVDDLANAKSFMVVGPADAKTEFVKHIHRFDPHLFARLTAVESAEAMTDAQLAALARDYFARADRIIPHPISID
jgi:stalled ribosome rescue protein Dom34